MLLGHFDGHRLKIAQEGRTAQRASAGTQAAQHLRLIPYTDLLELDPCFEGSGHILHKPAKVHPAIGCEVGDQLVAVKCVLYLDQLHIQLVLGDFLLTNFMNVFFAFQIGAMLLRILLAGDTDHVFQGGGDVFLADLMNTHDALGILHAPRRFDDHRIACRGP